MTAICSGSTAAANPAVSGSAGSIIASITAETSCGRFSAIVSNSSSLLLSRSIAVFPVWSGAATTYPWLAIASV